MVLQAYSFCTNFFSLLLYLPPSRYTHFNCSFIVLPVNSIDANHPHSELTMNRTICILDDHQRTDYPLGPILTDAGYTLFILHPDQKSDSEQLQHVFLIICPGHPRDVGQRLVQFPIPEHVPILVLDANHTWPDTDFPNSDSRLIDHLEPTAPVETLLARIAFLHKAARISRERQSFLAHHQNFLDWFSSRDGLTGLYNRHQFNQQLAAQFANARTRGSELSLLLLDVDNFGEINKDCGQSFGDFVLNELAARITRNSRREDLCFRLSGGEFAILMPGANLIEARKCGKSYLTCCEDKPFARNAIERYVTLSVGLASVVANRPHSYDELVNMAQTALFKAKAEGRNRLYVFAPAETSDLSPDGCNFDTVKLAINRLLEKTRNSTISSLQLLARDLAGPSHRQHLERVAAYLELLGKRLGLTPPIIRTLQNAAILHTSIRQLIHNDLLAKKDKFSHHERDIMRDFPYKLSEIIDIFDYFSQERQILLTRTERFDGNGYPEGLKGDEIPLGARIIGIVDAFAAMTAERPFRASLSPLRILQELKNEAGGQFDPFLVTCLLDLIDEHQLLDIPSDQMARIRSELADQPANRKS